jgi:hypothetical protein
MVLWRSRLWWLVPVAALGALLGFELGWGRQVHRLPEAPPIVEAKQVTPALLPEYKIEGGLAGRAETVNRSLFNPTRRPAPLLAAEAGRSQMQRGQFVLTGTSLAGERAIAFLREVPGGKARTVRQGEQINGMLVAEVKPDRVRLSVGGDSEELVLKIAAGPRTTVNPAPTAPPAAQSPQFGTPSAVPTDATQVIEQRRRAAQAAGAAQAPPVMPAPAPNTSQPGTPASAAQGTVFNRDPEWNEVYERMRQRIQPSK